MVVQPERDWDALFRQSGERLWRAVFAYAGGRRDIADEAVAEAFARAMEHSSSIREPVPWLYRTAFRIALAELKRGRRQSELTDGPAITAEPEVEDLARALRKLSPSQRAAVYLHHQADLPVREVAHLMGTSVAAVKVHLHRGRNRLRELLGAEDVEEVAGDG